MPCFIAKKHNKKEEMEREIRKGTIPYFIAIKHNKREEMEREIRKGIYVLYFEFFPRELHNKKRRNGKGKKQKHTFTKLDSNKTPNKEKIWKGKQKGTNVLVCDLSTASKIIQL